MKRNVLLLLKIFLVCKLVFGQQDKAIQSDRVYAFLNQIKGNDSVKYNLSSHMGFGIFRDELSSILSDSIFTSEDITYMNKQLQESQKTAWEKGKIKGANVISKRKIKRVFSKKRGWEKFRKKYGKSCLNYFSIPLFNVAHNYCVFYHWTQCDYTTGRGDLSLYQLKNGKWLFVEYFVMGVS